MVECLYIIFFRYSLARDQSSGNKRMMDSPLPESLILNLKAMNPDLKSIIKQTKHFIPFSFFTGYIFTEFDCLKQRQVIGLRSVSKKPILCPTMPASLGYYRTGDYKHHWTIIMHYCRKLEIMTNHDIIWFIIEYKEVVFIHSKHVDKKGPSTLILISTRAHGPLTVWRYMVECL